MIALLEWGDVAEADTEIADFEDTVEGADSWQAPLWRGMRALMEGRFATCERLASEAAERGEHSEDALGRILATLLLVALRREQERPAEAEIMLRALLDAHPSAPAGAHALLALLVGEMGRDAQARQELARLLPREPVAAGRLAPLFLLAELAVAVDAPPDDLELLRRRLSPHTRDFAVEEGGAVFYGSVALALGRVAQAGGRWEEAIGHYEDALEAHVRVGAPVLLAHTERHLAALLRTREGDGDWERAVTLLSDAMSIYRHLGIDGLAAKTQAVLARSEDALHHDSAITGTRPLFRRQGDVWMIGPPDDPARLRDAKGLQDIARLLAAPGMSLHVADLLTGSGDPRDGTADRALAAAFRNPWVVNWPVLDEGTRLEYEARLNELAGELVEAERAGNAVRAAMARAERDVLTAALNESDEGDPVEQARRAVGTRIRISLDRIEQAQPAVGRHLRTSIRTGTFCAYQADSPVRWAL